MLPPPPRKETPHDPPCRRMSTIPGFTTCAAPDPITRKPARPLPAHACDCHAHVVGAPPYADGITRIPPQQSTDAYLTMLDLLGFDRGVLVQLSVHGTDNGAMLDALRAEPDRLRGVAVIAPDISDGDLDVLASSGVRGVRYNLNSPGGPGLAGLDAAAARIAPLGWHVQVFADADRLAEIGPRLAALPCPVVFDHMGLLPPDGYATHPAWAMMTQLLRDGRAWVKLSAPYRIAGDAAPLARAFIAAAPERLVWGTDWPHTWASPMPDTVGLLDTFDVWCDGDEALRQRILVDNPAALYGFAAATSAGTG